MHIAQRKELDVHKTKQKRDRNRTTTSLVLDSSMQGVDGQRIWLCLSSVFESRRISFFKIFLVSKYRKENRCVKIHELRFLSSKLSLKAAHNVIHYVFHAIKIKRRQIIIFFAHTMMQNTSTTSSYNAG